MNLSTSFALLTVASLQLAHAQRLVQEQPDNFYTGMIAGQCLFHKCEIFDASLLTETPADEKPVLFRVEKSLFGPAKPGDVVGVPYVDPKRFFTSSRPIQGVWLAAALSFVAGERVTTIVALEDMEGAHAGDPLLITKKDRTIEGIRSVLEYAARLDTSPGGLMEAVASVSRLPDGPTAGYLFAYIDGPVAGRDAELHVALLDRLVESPSVPASARDRMAPRMGLEYFRLSASGKSVVVRRFVALSGRPNASLAVLRFRGIAQLHDFNMEMRPLLAPAEIEKLTRHRKVLTYSVSAH